MAVPVPGVDGDGGELLAGEEAGERDRDGAGDLAGTRLGVVVGTAAGARAGTPGQVRVGTLAGALVTANALLAAVRPQAGALATVKV